MAAYVLLKSPSEMMNICSTASMPEPNRFVLTFINSRNMAEMRGKCYLKMLE